MIVGLSEADNIQADFSQDANSGDDENEDSEIEILDFNYEYEDEFIDPVSPAALETLSRSDEDAQSVIYFTLIIIH